MTIPVIAFSTVCMSIPWLSWIVASDERDCERTGVDTAVVDVAVVGETGSGCLNSHSDCPTPPPRCSQCARYSARLASAVSRSKSQ